LITKERILDSLRTLRDASGRDAVEAGVVVSVAVCDGHVSVKARPGPAGSGLGGDDLRGLIDAAVRRAAHEAGATLAGLSVEFVAPGAGPGGAGAAARRGGESAAPSPVAGHVIAVGAGKGGVGKSTVAVNLAVGLARGSPAPAVGLLDADIYGPSVPTLLGLDGMDASAVGGVLQPFAVHGVRAMTIGKLVDADKPLIWRGPMAHGAFRQLLEQTRWGELDYLVIDLPPGTGDVPLSMAQLLSVTGAVVVCTPQKVAQDDAVRAARMFQALNIPVLGVVENMSYFIGDDGKEYDIFGRGGAEMMAQRLGLPFLGAVPIHMELRANSDAGDPGANFRGNEPLRSSLESLVRRVRSELALAAARSGGPVMTVS
jgi:ATP-binding protein involved in chromosome partitioning